MADRNPMLTLFQALGIDPRELPKPPRPRSRPWEAPDRRRGSRPHTGSKSPRSSPRAKVKAARRANRRRLMGKAPH